LTKCKLLLLKNCKALLLAELIRCSHL